MQHSTQLSENDHVFVRYVTSLLYLCPPTHSIDTPYQYNLSNPINPACQSTLSIHSISHPITHPINPLKRTLSILPITHPFHHHPSRPPSNATSLTLSTNSLYQSISLVSDMRAGLLADKQVLVHCDDSLQRCGAVVASYCIIYNDMSPSEATSFMKVGGG